MVRWIVYPLLCGVLAGCVTIDETGSLQRVDNIEASEARVTLGLNYLKAGQWQRARDNLEKALDFAPNYDRALGAMAYYYQQVDEPEAAEAMYRRALRQSPKNGDMQNNYGVFLCSQQRYDEAIAAFEKALKQPDYHQTSASYENAAFCSLKNGAGQQARDYFLKALAYDPHRPKSILQLARLEMDAQNVKEARARLLKFNQRYGYQADSLWLLYQLELQAGRPDTAAQYVELLGQKYPNSQQYQKYLANEY
ncbi:type IV pilus biogenesis/stability protein PilW [Photobacterium sp. MCCC 1A19761]|uniref:type IV pilus biogenesis/stability protein PilW n=1 Tax=Photobacterium sp. MCCC 1A19761 TaxID=3115000 RepID=UPI00307F6B17